jgi:Domain of unknown function (DUF4276)
MKPLYFTLAAEGSSDEMLLPIIEWTLRTTLGPEVAVNWQFSWSSRTIKERIKSALDNYSDTNLLIVHADTDGKYGHAARVEQIHEAAAELSAEGAAIPHHIPIVPVRESEAWLLFDESAIRSAAENPHGKVRLKLPTQRFDQIADPKKMLNDLLDAASEQTGRKLASFQRRRVRSRVADWIDNFAPLRKLEAFIAFESEVKKFAAVWTVEEE